MVEPAAEDTEDRDPGLARERTELAWTRTGISMAGLGAIILHSQLVAGLVVLGAAAVVWRLGRLATRRLRPARGRIAQLLTAVTCAVALLALVLALVLPTRA